MKATLVSIVLALGGVAEANNTCQDPAKVDPFDARPVCASKITKPTSKKPVTKPAVAPTPAPAPAKPAGCQPRDRVDPFDARPVCATPPPKTPAKATKPVKKTT